MQDCEHLDDLGHAVDENVIGMDDRLARAGYATGAVDVGMVGQAVGGVLDGVAEAQRGGGPAFGDIVDDLVQVLTRLWPPDDPQRHFFW